MTDIEPKEKFRQKAIDLINEYRVQQCLEPIVWLVIDTPEVSAFIRAIQLHEKTKQELSDFRQAVSDAILRYLAPTHVPHGLKGFIIPAPKPDPLVAALEGVTFDHYPPNDAKTIRAALDALGFEIREKNEGQNRT
jgi:hypothetical protein